MHRFGERDIGCYVDEQLGFEEGKAAAVRGYETITNNNFNSPKAVTNTLCHPCHEVVYPRKTERDYRRLASEVPKETGSRQRNPLDGKLLVGELGDIIVSNWCNLVLIFIPDNLNRRIENDVLNHLLVRALGYLVLFFSFLLNTRDARPVGPD
jgi:hypothetical protein